jgi:hypothetical protein
MRILKSLGAAVCGLWAVVLIATATPMHAQAPSYLQALSDLRTARDYIQSDHRPQFEEPRRHAVDEINKAIEEIKHAAWDDGKNTKYAPPSGGVTDPWMPMRAAADWLGDALKQVNSTPDQPANQGLQQRATMHIAEARHTIGRIYEMAGH